MNKKDQEQLLNQLLVQLQTNQQQMQCILQELLRLNNRVTAIEKKIGE